jgi:hypothetical protein
MIKLKKMILPILGLGITTTAVSLSLTSCQPVYLILRDIDFSNGTMSDNAVAPQNSRIIDATNTMLYQDNYVFT